MRNAHVIRFSAAIGIALLVAALDQLVKGLVKANMFPNESQPVLGQLLSLTYRQNTGTAFSLFHDSPMLGLILANLLVLGIFSILIYPYVRKRIGVMAAALVFGGAIGNLIDRIHLGYVVDFLDLHVWPVFNIADMSIVAGVVLLLVMLIFTERKPAEKPGGSGS